MSPMGMDSRLGAESQRAIEIPTDLSLLALLELRRGRTLERYESPLQLDHKLMEAATAHGHLVHEKGLCWACGHYRMGGECHAAPAIVGGHFFFPVPAHFRYYGLVDGTLHVIKTSKDMEPPWFDARPKRAHPDAYPAEQRRVARAALESLKKLERLPYLEPRPRSIGIRVQWHAGSQPLSRAADVARWFTLCGDETIRLIAGSQWRVPDSLMPEVSRHCEALERELVFARARQPQLLKNPVLKVDAKDAMQWLLMYRPQLFNEMQGRGEAPSLDAAINRYLQQRRAAMSAA